MDRQIGLWSSQSVCPDVLQGMEDADEAVGMGEKMVNPLFSQQKNIDLIRGGKDDAMDGWSSQDTERREDSSSFLLLEFI